RRHSLGSLGPDGRDRRDDARELRLLLQLRLDAGRTAPAARARGQPLPLLRARRLVGILDGNHGDGEARATGCSIRHSLAPGLWRRRHLAARVRASARRVRWAERPRGRLGLGLWRVGGGWRAGAPLDALAAHAPRVAAAGGRKALTGGCMATVLFIAMATNHTQVRP